MSSKTCFLLYLELWHLVRSSQNYFFKVFHFAVLLRPDHMFTWKTTLYLPVKALANYRSILLSKHFVKYFQWVATHVFCFTQNSGWYLVRSSQNYFFKVFHFAVLVRLLIRIFYDLTMFTWKTTFYLRFTFYIVSIYKLRKYTIIKTFS